MGVCLCSIQLSLGCFGERDQFSFLEVHISERRKYMSLGGLCAIVFARIL